MPEKRLIHHGGQPIVEPPESGQTRQPSGFLSEQFAREEKSRDPKTEKIPAIRFRGFTDAWEQREFSEITYPAGEKNRDNHPYESFSITNEDGFVPQNEKFENGGTMRDADKRMYFIVSPNSFAYNPARINVGSIGYQNLHKNVIVSSLYEVFKTTSDVDDRFLWHWFKSENFQRLIEHLQEGGVRLYFYYDKLCQGHLPLPTIEEQQEIGRYFDHLDHLITLHQRKHEKLVRIKKALLEKMFPKNGTKIPEIRFSGFTDAWEQRELGENCEITTGGTPTTSNSDYWNPKEIPWLSSGEVHKKRISATDDKISRLGLENSSARWVKPCSVLVALAGQGKTRGTVAINEIALTTNQSIAAIYPEEHDAEFLFQNLESRYEELRAISSADGSRGGLNKHLLSAVTIPYAETREQQKIGIFFRDLDSLITLHQRELEKLRNIKKACLEKMFV